MDTAASVQNKAQDIAAGLTPQIDQARERLEAINHQVTSFIKEKPGTCLLGALAVGFLIGRIASR
jgi:ElaB/YqjD/DUF883 family membrane-anchored ribosome-binding protein